MIKILYQLNQLGYGGTEKAIQTICENIDRTRFEIYLFFQSKIGTPKFYMDKIRALFSDKYKQKFTVRYVNSIARKPSFEELFGCSNIACGGFSEFRKFVNNINPDIIHFNRGNSADFYTAEDRKSVV